MPEVLIVPDAPPAGLWQGPLALPRSRELSLAWVRRYVGPHDRAVLSVHRQWELTLVLDGSGTWYAAGMAVPLRRGTAVLVPPGVRHREDATRVDLVWVGLAGSRLAGLGLRRAITCHSDELPALAEQLWRRACCSAGPTGVEAEGLAATALGLVLRRAEDEAAGGDAIDDAIDFLHRHLADCPSMASLAARARLSEGYFFRAFRRRTGATPRAYLARIRLERARALLERSDLPVAEVARLVGYADPLYFSRAFSRAYGRPPSAAR